uniref:MATH domain-containing protein n=1 Tax=Globodera pallida TaxID=36090 RepID=A0A183CPJ1_GLOPA
MQKRRDQIVLRMKNFKDFYAQLGPKTVLGDPVEFINGLPWRIMIKDCDEYVGLHLYCNGNEAGGAILICEC